MALVEFSLCALGPRCLLLFLVTLLYGFLKFFMLGLQLGKDAPATQIFLQLLSSPTVI